MTTPNPELGGDRRTPLTVQGLNINGKAVITSRYDGHESDTGYTEHWGWYCLNGDGLTEGEQQLAWDQIHDLETAYRHE